MAAAAAAAAARPLGLRLSPRIVTGLPAAHTGSHGQIGVSHGICAGCARCMFLTPMIPSCLLVCYSVSNRSAQWGGAIFVSTTDRSTLPNFFQCDGTFFVNITLHLSICRICWIHGAMLWFDVNHWRPVSVQSIQYGRLDASDTCLFLEPMNCNP
ncbi:uncharacterized protein BJ171DRAFT_90574 [Polychytrium aggregatum]|uniref:uncharacterized protein n=1 Tax=Polychytrium aggregatum TaxID=110093 RepID=UPI0022FE862D|nr:uncharacterized protein BJ171DRAFT_90574 [Polychytrium aggregatum]KAI9204845.1 hypothetical protein BJ171DRAFT_90574 [Polychytrium aggregatum]